MGHSAGLRAGTRYGWSFIFFPDQESSVERLRMIHIRGVDDGIEEQGLIPFISLLSRFQEEGHDRPLNIPETIQSWRYCGCGGKRCGSERHGRCLSGLVAQHPHQVMLHEDPEIYFVVESLTNAQGSRTKSTMAKPVLSTM